MGSLIWAFSPLLMLALGDELITHASRARLLFLVLAMTAFFVVSTTAPKGAVVALFVVLPFLGLARRMLIPVAGWSSRDPLVLLSAAAGAILLARLFLIEGRPLSRDRYSRLVLALVFVALVESVNPRGGGINAGVAGFLYVGMPILWFFIGREILDEATVKLLLWLTVPIGVIVGAYGLFQLSGLPSWDAEWVKASGYAALIVGTSTRPFGTFASSAEYATYLSIGAVVSVALWTRGRLGGNALGVLAAPFLAIAMFYDSSRGTVVLTVLGVFVVVGLSLGSSRKMIATVSIGVAIAAGGLHTYSGSLNNRASASGSAYVTHQVGGLTHPLNSKQSTLSSHFTLFIGGFKSAVQSPLGHGTGPISRGGTSLGAQAVSSEIDISDAFIGLGVVGGVLFLAVFIGAFRIAIRTYLLTRSSVVLAVCGVLVVTCDQWLNGDFYAITPFVWTLIGWVCREESHAQRAAA